MSDAVYSDESIDRLVIEAALQVEPLFKHHGWTWRDAEEPPTVAEIAASLRDKVRSLLADPEVTATASGRLRVTRCQYENAYEELRISLDLSEAERYLTAEEAEANLEPASPRGKEHG